MAENATETQEIVIPVSAEWSTSPSPAPVVEVVSEVTEGTVKNSEEKPDNPENVEQTTGDTSAPVSEKPAEVVVKAEEKAIIEPAPLTFANEESEHIFNLIKEGKKDEVFAILSEQKKLSEADKLPPAEIIKLKLQYDNKDFSPKEINDLFEDTYMRPETPIQSPMEDDDDFKVRMDKYNAQVERIESRITRDAKPAVAALLKLQKEIVLPDIQKQAATAQAPSQEELEAQKVQAQKFLQSVDEGLKTFNGYQSTFKDEEVELSVNYKMSKEEKEEIQPIIALANSNAGEFLAKIGWLDKEGNINAAKLAEDLPLIMNKTKIISKMVTESATQRYAEAKKSIKNIDYGKNKTSGGELGETPEQLQSKMATHFFSN